MNAIGLIETIGYVCAIEASDACVKSANVNVVSIDKVGAGIVTLTICGDVGAVKSAVEAGEMAASRVGTVRATHVIPRMHSEVSDVLFKKEEPNELEVLDDTINNYETTLDISEDESQSDDEGIESTEDINENLDSSENKVDEEIKITEDTLAETDKEKIEPSNVEQQILEVDEIETIDFDKNDLSKNSVKELKAIAKKLDSSITYKELNLLKKEELINLVKKLRGEDR